MKLFIKSTIKKKMTFIFDNFFILIFRGSFLKFLTAWKVSVFGVILVCIFPHLDWIYGEILPISPYSVQMRENTDQTNSKDGHFLRSASCCYFAVTIARLWEDDRSLAIACWVSKIFNFKGLSFSYRVLIYLKYIL